MSVRRISALVGAVAALTLGLAGCSDTPSSISYDQNQTNRQLNQYDVGQPAHFYLWSQYRQTLLDVEDAQANGVTTTTFFYNTNSVVPIRSCPSVGFPIASTAQITNPQQVVWGGSNDASGVIGQLEPNGVYTGDSTGTYVVCITPTGAKDITYWEGFVETEGGPAHFDKATGQIVLDGAPTVKSVSRPKSVPIVTPSAQ